MRNRFILPTLALTTFLQAGIALAEEYKLQSASCKIYEVEKGKFVPSRITPESLGTVIQGKPHGPNHVLTQKDGRNYLLPNSCVSVVEAPVEPSLPSYWTVAVSLFSWKETLNLANNATGVSYDISANYVGVCPGVQWLKPFSSRLGAGLTACGMFATSEAGATSQVGVTTPDYQVRGSTMFGAQVGPQLLWTPGTEAMQLGVSLPVILRIHNLPAPTEANYELSSSLLVAPGLFFETKLRGQRFGISSKVGIIKPISSLSASYSWALALECRL